MQIPGGLRAVCFLICRLLHYIVRLWQRQETGEEHKDDLARPQNDKASAIPGSFLDKAKASGIAKNLIANNVMNVLDDANSTANAINAMIDNLAAAKTALNYNSTVAQVNLYFAKTNHAVSMTNNFVAGACIAIAHMNANAHADVTKAIADARTNKAIVKARSAISYANAVNAHADKAITALAVANVIKAIVADASAVTNAKDAVWNAHGAIANANDATTKAAKAVALATDAIDTSHANSVIIGQHHCQLH